MRAAVLREQVFSVEERATPMPGPGQVLLKTRLCGICGSDLHLFKHGAEVAKLGEDLGAPKQDLARGLILGHEFVGEIAAFGPDTAKTLQVGDRVVSVPFLIENGAPLPIGASIDGGGAYGEYFLASEMLLLKVPDDVPDAAAALVEPLAIAVHAVAKSMLVGDSHPCVILGCGPIGLAVAAVLEMNGVTTIIASDFSPKRRALADTIGATRSVDSRLTSPFADFPATQPVVVFDCTGAKGVLARTMRDVPTGSQIVVAGIAPGEETIQPMLAISKEIALQFVLYYKPEEFAEALQAVADGKLDWQPLVTGTVGLDAIPQAFAALEDPETHAKIMIDPWSNAAL